MELPCNLYSNMSTFCARFSEQVLVSFPHSGGSRPSPWEPSSSSEDSLSGTRAWSSWPSTLTLLDSIMPVLAWNLTVFNLARSFFSTLWKKEKKKKGEISLGWAWAVAVAVALSGISTLRTKSECTFSCSEWPQSAHSLHVAWPASPATTRRQKHLWHGGYPHKRSSGLGWAGSCPSFGRSQTKLCKNTGFGYTPSFLLSWICVRRFHMHQEQIISCLHLAHNGSYEFPVLH